MEIEQKLDGTALTMILSGSLNTLTSPQLENTIAEVSPEIESLTLDFSKVDFISSAGLRVLVSANRSYHAEKKAFAICNLSENVQAVIEMTGLNGLLKVDNR